MDAQKFQVKLFVEDPSKVRVEAIVPVFHGFIREKKLPTLLVDVADYGHVPKGPGVALIGFEANYYVEFDEGRPGVRYSHKRDANGDLPERLGTAFRNAFTAASLLEAEPSLDLRFGTAELQVRVVDRLHAPNEDASLEALRPALESVLAKAFGGAPYEVERTGTSREPFTLKITRSASEPVSVVAARL